MLNVYIKILRNLFVAFMAQISSGKRTETDWQLCFHANFGRRCWTAHHSIWCSGSHWLWWTWDVKSFPQNQLGIRTFRTIILLWQMISSWIPIVVVTGSKCWSGSWFQIWLNIGFTGGTSGLINDFSTKLFKSSRWWRFSTNATTPGRILLPQMLRLQGFYELKVWIVQ